MITLTWSSGGPGVLPSKDLTWGGSDMHSRPRPRRIVSSSVLRAFRVMGWRYSSHRRAWVFAPLGGRVGPVLRLSERPQATNSVTISSNDLWITSTPRADGPLPSRRPVASLQPAPLRVVTTPVTAPEPPTPMTVELERTLEQELAATAGAKAAPAPRAQPGPPPEHIDPSSSGTRWPFLVGPRTVRAVASVPALTLVPDSDDRELDIHAAYAAAPFRLPQRVRPASRAASAPAPAPSRNAARPAPPLPGEPRLG